MTIKSPKHLQNDALLICTRNRFNELDNLSKTLNNCAYLPEILVIIDASDEFNEEFLKHIFGGIFSKVLIKHTTASLPYQRNIGTKLLPLHVQNVHFIDDDFHPEPFYFYHLSNFLNKSDFTILGSGGSLISTKNKSNTSVFHTLFNLDSHIPGIVLSSGRTTEPQAITTSIFAYSTQFLSGCSMSFKKSTFESFSFDEHLSGYAQDEDLAFCLQLPKNSLYVVPEAKGRHLKSLSNRLVDFTFKKSSVINRFYVMNKYAPTVFNKSSFYFSLLGQTLILAKHPIKNLNLIKGLVSGWIEILKKEF